MVYKIHFCCAFAEHPRVHFKKCSFLFRLSSFPPKPYPSPSHHSHLPRARGQHLTGSLSQKSAVKSRGSTKPDDIEWRGWWRRARSKKWGTLEVEHISRWDCDWHHLDNFSGYSKQKRGQIDLWLESILTNRSRLGAVASGIDPCSWRLIDRRESYLGAHPGPFLMAGHWCWRVPAAVDY